MTSFAAIFPGQGSQHPGMGKALAASFPEAADVFATADRVLGESLSETCFAGTEAELSRTATTQPAILAVSVAAYRVLAARGFSPAAFAGHSLGEWSAHVAAGTIPFEDALLAVRARGRFMQEAVPEGEGAMAAIFGLSIDVIETICRDASEGETVEIANRNGGGQVVIAGHAAAVDRAVRAAESAGARRAVTLPVSAPFHCRLMRPAAERLREVLDGIPFLDPSRPVWTNVDAAPVRTGPEAKRALLEQVASPVRWHDEVEGMAGTGIDTFVEIGPGRVLSGLVRRIRDGVRALQVSDPESLAKTLTALEIA